MNKELLTVWKRERQTIHHENEESLEKSLKKIDDLLRLENGRIVEIEKPGPLKTSFCFAEGIQCQTSYEEAQDMADHAQNSEDYFRAENLKDIDDLINLAEDDNTVLFSRPYNQRSDILSSVHHCSLSEWAQKQLGDQIRWDFTDDPVMLTQSDVEKYIDALKNVRAKLNKRITAYLKRYGMSKVTTWTYWADR